MQPHEPLPGQLHRRLRRFPADWMVSMNFMQLRMPDQFGQQASAGLGFVHLQQAGGGGIEVEHPPLQIHGQDALRHAGQHRLQFIALAGDGFACAEPSCSAIRLSAWPRRAHFDSAGEHFDPRLQVPARHAFRRLPHVL